MSRRLGEHAVDLPASDYLELLERTTRLVELLRESIHASESDYVRTLLPIVLVRAVAEALAIETLEAALEGRAEEGRAILSVLRQAIEDGWIEGLGGTLR